MKEDELIKLIDVLNPENEAGRLNLIVRMGNEKIAEYFPKLLARVEKEGKKTSITVHIALSMMVSEPCHTTYLMIL
jgi:3-deoxy-D-arabino-heptulosonate 7-phosphate (DAHP) synthase class II